MIAVAGQEQEVANDSGRGDHDIGKARVSADDG
jgi:hypothetical protein